MGEDALFEEEPEGMGAEDFPLFTVDPDITSVYWGIGGTPQADLDAEEAGGPAARQCPATIRLCSRSHRNRRCALAWSPR
jgi:hypothetical protein